MSQRLSFTVPLYHFLIRSGYSHIHYRGIEKLPEPPADLPQDNYILVPLKEDLSLRFEESQLMVEEIHSLDVREMLEYTLGIDFWVELPEKVVRRFQLEQP